MSKDNNQLPPELVEKMWRIISSTTITNKSDEKCAKIAVDYSNEVSKELIECLEHIKLFMNGTGYSRTYSEEKFDILEKIDNHLLKKHKND